MSNLCKCGHRETDHDAVVGCLCAHPKPLKGESYCSCKKFVRVSPVCTPLVPELGMDLPPWTVEQAKNGRFYLRASFDVTLLTEEQRRQFSDRLFPASEAVQANVVADDLAPAECTPKPSETSVKMNQFLDLLRWFYDNRIELRVSPAPKGWHTEFKMKESQES